MLIGLGWLLVVSMLVGVGLLSLAAFPWVYPVLCGAGGFLGHYVGKRREQSRLQAAISAALAEIVEHQAAPEVHSLVGELRVLSGDVIQQERAARQACREVVDRIEAATARCRGLPVIAGALEDGRLQLPVPAEPAPPVQSTLPRV